MDGIKSIKDLTVEGKRVFVRVDFNVPLSAEGQVGDDARMVAALPTIRYLIEHGAKVILASHLGRPKGRRNEKYTLRPVARGLATLLNQPILFLEDCIGPEVEKAVAEMAENSVVLLENLRFHVGEEANDTVFAKQLVRLADVYVNDAFGTLHRTHASIVGMVQYVPEKAVGFLVEKELNFLTQILERPVHPFCVVLGGAKVSDKIGIVESLLDKADRILIGGAMAFTFALAQGQSVGKSLVELDWVERAKALLEKAKTNGVDLRLPIDTVATDKVDFDRPCIGNTRVIEGSLDDPWVGVDIGPKTADVYAQLIRSSKTVFWNGPVGLFQIEEAAQGCYQIANAMAACEGFTVVGGGDCLKAIRQSGCAEAIQFLSTGGGASLRLLEGKPLPGIEVLRQ